MSEAPLPKAEIGILLYPRCQQAMAYGMTDLITIAGQYSVQHGGQPLRVSRWQLQEGGGFARIFDTREGLSTQTMPEIWLIPGRLSGVPDAEEAAPYARWLLDRHAQGATLASNCGGAFLLAATGLLSGRPATTHWWFADQFRTRFPDVKLDCDRIVIDDGDILTAGGLMAWTDLGLRLVERLLGPTVMLDTAKFLLIDSAGREQKHFARFMPRLTHGDEPILKAQHWLAAHPIQTGAKAISVRDMAAQVGMEERTFQRRFKAATTMTPIEYVQHLRVAKARELLEFTKRPVDQIAWSAGYEDAAAFRKLFHRLIGLSPGDYRQRFAVPSAQAA